MSISGKHLRIYTIIFDNGNPGEVGPLVYAQNLSRYGSVWKSVITKREDAAVLLSDGDTVELSPFTSLKFRAREAPQMVAFSEAQRKEMKVFASLPLFLPATLNWPHPGWSYGL